jgi:hypothetical protein
LLTRGNSTTNLIKEVTCQALPHLSCIKGFYRNQTINHTVVETFFTLLID